MVLNTVYINRYIPTVGDTCIESSYNSVCLASFDLPTNSRFFNHTMMYTRPMPPILESINLNMENIDALREIKGSSVVLAKKKPVEIPSCFICCNSSTSDGTNCCERDDLYFVLDTRSVHSFCSINISSNYSDFDVDMEVSLSEEGERWDVLGRDFEIIYDDNLTNTSIKRDGYFYSTVDMKDLDNYTYYEFIGAFSSRYSWLSDEDALVTPYGWHNTDENSERKKMTKSCTEHVLYGYSLLE